MKKSMYFYCFILFLCVPHTAYTVSDADLLSQICYGCHGTDGISVGDAIPSLAGLDKRYFKRTMLNFKRGKRDSTIMSRIALGYTLSEIRKISGHFADLKWTNTTAKLDKEQILLGKKIHDESCEECHSESGKFQDHEVPRISGQTVKYLYYQMQDYQINKETMPQPEKMRERLEKLKTEELKSLSHFYAAGR